MNGRHGIWLTENMQAKPPKEKIADILIVVIAWAVALSLVVTAYLKYKALHIN